MTDRRLSELSFCLAAFCFAFLICACLLPVALDLLFARAVQTKPNQFCLYVSAHSGPATIRSLKCEA